MNANKCISYQTIENKDEIPQEYKSYFGNKIFGCDECQNACPWNKNTPKTNEEELKPRKTILEMTKLDWDNLNEITYNELSRGSALKRVKIATLKRNIEYLK